MTPRTSRRRTAVAAFTVALPLSLIAACGGGSDSGSSGDTIVVGTSMATSGAGSETCTPIREGAQAWIDQVNADGGVGGREIEVRLEDDGYQASEALANAREFAADDDLVAFFNGCGSPTAAAIATFAEQQGVPFLFPWADVPEALNNSTFYSLVPGNGEMAAAVLTETMDDLGPGSVYVITLALPGIEASLQQIATAAEEAGGSYLGDTRITINEADMNAVVLKAKNSGADYLVTVTNSSDSAKLINTLDVQNAFPGKAVVTSTSTPTASFLSGIDEDVDLSKIVATSVPATPSDPSASACVAAIEEYAPDLAIDSMALTGCANAQALVGTLEAAGDDITRESVLEALSDYQSDDVAEVVGPISFSSDQHLGVNLVHGVRFVDGEMEIAYVASLESE